MQHETERNTVLWTEIEMVRILHLAVNLTLMAKVISGEDQCVGSETEIKLFAGLESESERG